jgi:hypothetical protein
MRQRHRRAEAFSWARLPPVQLHRRPMPTARHASRGKVVAGAGVVVVAAVVASAETKVMARLQSSRQPKVVQWPASIRWMQ